MSKVRRVRDVGITTGRLNPGLLNSIADVPGVRVGHCTVDFGQGALVRGSGPARTGVTVVMPHEGDLWNEKPSAAFYALNGCGVVTGGDWINESGALEGPIALTNSHSVGDVGSALIRWMADFHPEIGIEEAYLPVIGECDDSYLNDINGFHVKDNHVLEAIKGAGRDVAEGAVGAGRGMSCYGYKGGIGTASRVVSVSNRSYVVGCLVNSNHGRIDQLMINGVHAARRMQSAQSVLTGEGSIVMLVATDAPLNHLQLKRLCKRAPMGLALTGSCAGDSSGDFVLGFSTGRLVPRRAGEPETSLPELHNDYITPFFEAVIEATEEAVLNSLFCNETVTGRDGNTVHAFPVDEYLRTLARN
ncbi:MAG: P1 family peptidase [Candidatus Obscuribacterales bacterium]|nr:P1 family peptidase [Candidatus Obscuribacterales bacterium]